MKKQEFLTDEQVEVEINRLLDSEAVKLAKLEQRIRYRRRQYMYGLRNMERRGLALMTQGINEANLERTLFGSEVDDEND